MPCGDITEILRITLDNDDRVVTYALNKLSCGGDVGIQSFLLDWISGKNASDIVSETFENFLIQHPAANVIEEFLMIKHFFAVQNGLKVLLGYEDGGTKSVCTVDGIFYSESGTELTARIKVNLLTDQIKSCGTCRSCGSKKPALARKIQAQSLL